MLEDEILSVLANLKIAKKTYESAAESLGVSKTTFYSWLKDGKGIKNSPLFQALDKVGVHITKTDDLISQEQSLPDTTLSSSCQDTEKTRYMIEAEILRAQNAELRRQNQMLFSLVSDSINKKDKDTSIPSSSLNKVS